MKMNPLLKREWHKVSGKAWTFERTLVVYGGLRHSFSENLRANKLSVLHTGGPQSSNGIIFKISGLRKKEGRLYRVGERGGAREGAGRKATDRVRLFARVGKATFDGLKKTGDIGKAIDHLYSSGKSLS